MDSTGAGDAFTGAFLAARLAGETRRGPPRRAAARARRRSPRWGQTSRRPGLT
ncbi:PfkB family carbohydrate kinase [Streptomyces diastatochromogenes]|nr:PfkB family carbohydrate kinase [Streptomyces diastatochromogenes]